MDADQPVSEEFTTHRVSIPNIDPTLVIDAVLEMGLESGRILPSFTMFDGNPYQTIDIEFETTAESIFPFIYQLGEILKDHVEVMIVNGEIWENTRAMAGLK